MYSQREINELIKDFEDPSVIAFKYWYYGIRGNTMCARMFYRYGFSNNLMLRLLFKFIKAVVGSFTMEIFNWYEGCIDNFTNTLKGKVQNKYGRYLYPKSSFPELDAFIIPLKYYNTFKLNDAKDEVNNWFVYLKYKEVISVEEYSGNKAYYEIIFMRTPVYNPFS